MDEVSSAIVTPFKRPPLTTFSPRRNKDIRLNDNRALALASATARELSKPLIVLHIFSPSDYVAHDRSPRRIDFQVRALKLLHERLAALHVPLHTVTFPDRKELEVKLAELLEAWGASHLFGNLEYEVDELRRDEKVIRATIKAKKSGNGWRGNVVFVKDLCVVEPGKVLTKVRQKRRKSCDKRAPADNVRTSNSKTSPTPSTPRGTRTGSPPSPKVRRTTSPTPALLKPTTRHFTRILSSRSSLPRPFPPVSRGGHLRRQTRRS